MREHLEGLIGQTLRTPAERAPNTVLGIEGSRVRVATHGNPDGGLVSISLIQNAADRIFEGEEVVFTPTNRSAFLGAVLQTLDEVEVLSEPRRARLRQSALTSQANPDWQFDELVLALDLYLRWRDRQPPPNHPDLVALSDLLRSLPIHPEHMRADDFRSPDSVRRKLADFRAPDPEKGGRPTKGGRGVHLVWKEFADNPEALAAAVARIRGVSDGLLPAMPPEEGELEAVEGRILYREHRLRERNPDLVRRKKQQARQATGRLACEVCDIDFSEEYGEIGDGFMECHHTSPLATGSLRTTRLNDLSLVCANCHRMIHRGQPMLTIDQLRERLKA